VATTAILARWATCLRSLRRTAKPSFFPVQPVNLLVIGDQPLLFQQRLQAAIAEAGRSFATPVSCCKYRVVVAGGPDEAQGGSLDPDDSQASPGDRVADLQISRASFLMRRASSVFRGGPEHLVIQRLIRHEPL